MQYHSHPSCHYHYSCSSSPSFCPCQLTPLVSYCQPLQNSSIANSRCPSTTVHHHYHYLTSSSSTSSSPCCYSTSSCKTTCNPSKLNKSCHCKINTTFTSSSASSTTGSMSTHTSKTSSNTIISANSAQKDPGNHSKDPRHRHPPPNRSKLKQYKLLTHAIQELIQSERDYVDELYIMVEICLAALHQQKWMSTKHVAVMSRNLSDIFAFHQRLVISFRASIIMQDHSHSDSYNAMTTTSIESKCRIIARAFLDHQTEFKALYIEYCEGHSKAWKVCTDYRLKSEWPDFMAKCQGLIQAYQEGKSSAPTSSSASPPPSLPGKRIRFEDFLIKPIQRICRYQLLLKEIIRHANQYASITHPITMSVINPKSKKYSHQQLLTQAFDCMHTIATEIDRQNEAQESKERTHRFIERLDSDWRLAKDRVAQLGCLVISGAIDIRYQNGGSGETSPGFNDQHEMTPSFPSPPPSPSPWSKSRYLGCFVFASYVIIVQVKKQTLYEAKHWFPLHVVDLIDQDYDNSDFILQCQQHTFVCAATCAKEKQTWVDKIRSAKTALLLSQQRVDHTGIVSSLSNQPPINRFRQPSPPLLRSSTTFFDTVDQHQYHPHRSHSIVHSNHLPSSSSSPSLPTIIHQLPLSTEAACKKKKNRSLSTHITSTRYQSGSQPNSPTFRPTSSNIVSTEVPPPTRRHSSLDLFSMATHNLNRVSLHFKTQHRNALREAVDQRIRDVCTRDYLSSRARYLALDRKSSGTSAMCGTHIVSSSTSSTSSSLVLSPPSPPIVGAVPTTTSTAISSSSISSVSSSIPSPYYYGNHPSRTPSPTFLHPLASSPLSFKFPTPTSTPLKTSVAGPTRTKDKTPMEKTKNQSMDKGEASKKIELPSPSGKAAKVIDPPAPKERRGPRLIKSLWHHLIRSLKKKKKTKQKEELVVTQSLPYFRPMIIQEEEEEDQPEPQRKENCLLPSSPSAIMYSDFQLYRRSLNLE